MGALGGNIFKMANPGFPGRQFQSFGDVLVSFMIIGMAHGLSIPRAGAVNKERKTANSQGQPPEK